MVRAGLIAAGLMALVLGAARADGETQVVAGPYPWAPMCPGSHGVSLATPTTLAAAGMLPTGVPTAGRTCKASTLTPRQCIVSAKTATVYYTLDGVTTAGSTHTQIPPGGSILLTGSAQIAAAQFYSSSGVVDVECYH